MKKLNLVKGEIVASETTTHLSVLETPTQDEMDAQLAWFTKADHKEESAPKEPTLSWFALEDGLFVGIDGDSAITIRLMKATGSTVRLMNSLPRFIKSVTDLTGALDSPKEINRLAAQLAKLHCRLKGGNNARSMTRCLEAAIRMMVAKHELTTWRVVKLTK